MSFFCAFILLIMRIIIILCFARSVPIILYINVKRSLARSVPNFLYINEYRTSIGLVSRLFRKNESALQISPEPLWFNFSLYGDKIVSRLLRTEYVRFPKKLSKLLDSSKRMGYIIVYETRDSCFLLFYSPYLQIFCFFLPSNLWSCYATICLLYNLLERSMRSQPYSSVQDSLELHSLLQQPRRRY